MAIEYTGFVYNENKSAVDESNVQFNTQYVQYSPAGEYTIDANGFVSSKYDVVFEQSKIVVGKKDVTAKADIVFDKNTTDKLCLRHLQTTSLTVYAKDTF